MEEFFIPFLAGLGVGVLFAVVFYVRGMLKESSLNKKIKELKAHLHNKLELDSEANEKRKQELKELKKQNENLRITNQSLAQKPGRREVVNLHVYQKALSVMYERASGFAPMWQNALKEAEHEYKASETGTVPFIKKIIPLEFFGSKLIAHPSNENDAPSSKNDNEQTEAEG